MAHGWGQPVLQAMASTSEGACVAALQVKAPNSAGTCLTVLQIMAATSEGTCVAVAVLQATQAMASNSEDCITAGDGLNQRGRLLGQVEAGPAEESTYVPRVVGAGCTASFPTPSSSTASSLK